MNVTESQLTFNWALVLPTIIKLRLLFIKYSKFYFNIKKNKKRPQNYGSILSLSNVLRKEYILRKYTKRYYRRVFKKRYDRHLLIDNAVYNLWSSTKIWNPPFKAKISYKSFFHIKIFFNLSEFLMYDFYNFHKTMLDDSLHKVKIPNKIIPKKPWKKLNFFYRIRYSIDTFRTHTLQYFKVKFSTDRKTTVFFNKLSNLNPLSYIWFFEYSVPYFLVKIRLAESVSQGLMLALTNAVFINQNNALYRWSTVAPGDIIQMPFNIFLITRLRWMVVKFFDFFRKTKKFFKRTILRSKKYRTKMPNMTAKGNHLNSSKHLHLRLLESDYKSLTIILIPYVNPLLYYSALTLFWLNFWNFRINVWKYEI